MVYLNERYTVQWDFRQDPQLVYKQLWAFLLSENFQ